MRARACKHGDTPSGKTVDDVTRLCRVRALRASRNSAVVSRSPCCHQYALARTDYRYYLSPSDPRFITDFKTASRAFAPCALYIVVHIFVRVNCVFCESCLFVLYVCGVFVNLVNDAHVPNKEVFVHHR